ncbi:dynein light chain Tctex-type 1-like isoform X1 [Antennarius striatus]|uniref:dynein light chain Tctex-type 1-like isoform X1 n=1 Tax=Antennarius striatus TaxID=241820 RepID=UPI0035B13CF9
MAYFHINKERSFSFEEGEKIVKECIEYVVSGDDYSQAQAQNWTVNIVKRCATQLAQLGKSYKYIGLFFCHLLMLMLQVMLPNLLRHVMLCVSTVTCTVMPKRDAGLHMASCCYWDNVMDGSFMVKWENRTMFCNVNVFIIAML